MILALILAAISVTPAYTNINRAGGSLVMTNILEWAREVESEFDEKLDKPTIDNPTVTIDTTQGAVLDVGTGLNDAGGVVNVGNDIGGIIRVGTPDSPNDSTKVYVKGKEVVTEDKLDAKRDITNNVCAATALGEWDFSEQTAVSAGSYAVRIREIAGAYKWFLHKDGDISSIAEDDRWFPSEDKAKAVAKLIWITEPYDGTKSTRQRVAVRNELFVTTSFVTNETAKAAAAAVSPETVTNIVNATVSANLNTYIDGETGVEYVGKFHDGSLYYVPTGNVYPPNN